MTALETLIFTVFSSTIIYATPFYFEKRKRTHIKQLQLFKSQAEQFHEQPFVIENYLEWVEGVNTYLRKHFNKSYVIRFNQYRKTRLNLDDLESSIKDSLEGRLHRLTEFIIELKRPIFRKIEILDRNQSVTHFSQEGNNHS